MEQVFDNVKEYVEKAEFEKEYYLTELEKLAYENDELVNEVGELIIEAQNARQSFTGLQIAVSILIFVYGMLYGNYFNC